jgi:hypothetical protein
MAAAGRTQTIQDLVDRAAAASERESWFEAERVLERALTMSHGRHDYEGMAEILGLLSTVRAARRKLALASRAAVKIIDDAVTDTMDVGRGRYLVQPPLVGADARRLRLLALAREVPVMVLCREPLTQLGQIPIVAIGPLGAIRTRVNPPNNVKKPAAGWFRNSLLELGATAAARIDPGHAATRRLEGLLGLLDTLPEDDTLHELAIATCHEAMNESQ